jgi:hypothetical protein
MKLDAEVGTGTDVSVSAVDSTIPATGMYALRYWTAIPVASTADMVGWSTIWRCLNREQSKNPSPRYLTKRMYEILERHRVYGLCWLEAWEKMLNKASVPTSRNIRRCRLF